jgi:hypothetical protein
MIHPSQLRPNTPEEDEAYQYELPYIRIYHILLRDGLSVYEPTAKPTGLGLNVWRYFIATIPVILSNLDVPGILRN